MSTYNIFFAYKILMITLSALQFKNTFQNIPASISSTILHLTNMLEGASVLNHNRVMDLTYKLEPLCGQVFT